MAEGRSLDVFKGCYPATDILWLETVKGLDAATARMKEIAAQKPGRYFIFDAYNSTVLAVIDTTAEGLAAAC